MRPAVALFASGLAACAGSAGRGAAGDACVVVPAAAAPGAVARGEAAAGAAGAAGAAAGEPSDPVSEAGPDRVVVVGFSGPVDPVHAPVPRTAAERLVFAQLYRTVVRVTCEGRVEPAIASSWRMDDEGRRWSFTLHPDARDWDGAPVTAADVAASWVAAREALARDPVERRVPSFASVVVADPSALLVELDEPVTIGFFARPELAVRTSAATSGWPTGSGPYRPDPHPRPPGGSPSSLSLIPRAGGAGLEFRAVPRDARNALDTGVDLLVTDEPTVIDYAASSADFLAVPLAWDRSYLLVASPPDASPGSADATPRPRVVRPPDAALAALARDAVRVQARPARRVFDAGAVCGRATASPESAVSAPQPARPESAASAAQPADPGANRGGRAAGEHRERVAGGGGWPASRDRRIAYPAGDAVARSLAERLVALALDPRRPDAGWLADAVPELTRSGGRVSAVGLPASRFDDALRAGSDVAYVLPVERGAGTDPCDAIDALLGRAPWSERTVPVGEGEVTRIVPLVETRSTLVIRRGIGGVAVDGRGTLLLDGLRRAAAERASGGTPDLERGGTADREGIAAAVDTPAPARRVSPPGARP